MSHLKQYDKSALYHRPSFMGGHHTLKTVVYLCVALNSSSVFGEGEVYNFNISAGEMSTALSKLAETANIDLNYAAAMTSNLKSNGLKGNYTTEQALQELLKGSGLNYRLIGDNSITIEKGENHSKVNITSSPMTTMAAVKVTGKMVSNTIELDSKSYRRSIASTAIKSDTPIMETSYSVTVVPKQVLEDQKIIRVEDAVKNVAGVQASWTNGGMSDVFMLRGFQNLNLYRDGFLLPSALGGGTTKRQTANLEHIEILKGPGSVLYGRNEPGGVINLVTKRPQATSYNSVEQQIGSYDFYRTLVDSTGAITPDNDLLYRVNLSYENSNSFRNFVSTDSVFLAPSLTWNISRHTQVNLDTEYQHFDDTNDSGIPVIGNRPAEVSRSFQTGDPLNNKNVGDRSYVGLNWSHALNDDWKINHRFDAEFLDETQLYTFFSLATPGGNLVNGNSRGFNNAIVSQQEYYTTLNLNGKFSTGIFEHNILLGLDYFLIENQGASACCAAYPVGANFNVFYPVYQTSISNFNFVKNPDRNQEWYGLYLQDQIKLPHNLYGNVGLRYDNTVGRNLTSGVTTTDDDYVSPRGGLLWKPINWLSVYGNYSENFGPSNSLFNSNPEQAMLPPQTAQEWELGAKTEFFSGRLSATFAYFDLTRQHLSTKDPANPTLSRAVVEQESRGYEFESAGEILPGWRLIGAYTYMAFANITKDFDSTDGAGLTGKRIFNAPTNFGSLWSTYEFFEGNYRGLKLGGGISASSQSQGSNQNTFQLPGYTTVNLLASYGMKVSGKRVTLQLNANNLLDKTYYAGTNMGYMVGVGTPRTFLGSVKLEF